MFNFGYEVKTKGKAINDRNISNVPHFANVSLSLRIKGEKLNLSSYNKIVRLCPRLKYSSFMRTGNITHFYSNYF